MIANPLLTICPFSIADRLFSGDLGCAIYSEPKSFIKIIKNVPIVAEPVGSLNIHRAMAVQTGNFLPLAVITRALPLCV